MSEKSIRFFNDREVRAVWDEEHSKWWFSATAIKALLQQAMTDKIDDREIFMKGIDYSYYYEQTDFCTFAYRSINIINKE